MYWYIVQRFNESIGSYGLFVRFRVECRHFDYIERQRIERKEKVATYSLSDYPKELQKKVTLIHHFRNSLKGNSQENQIREGRGGVFVKKWMKTKHAMLFRLSNKIIEVMFEDKSEIIFCSQKREAIYVSKEGNWETFPLTSALNSNNTEMAKRFKYAKELLANIISSGSQTERKRELSKDTTSSKRIANELKALQRIKGQGFFIELKSETDINIWHISFEGPSNSLYKGGLYKTEVVFPPNYPTDPPTVRFLNEMWHPNIYSDGRPCIPVLKNSNSKERWQPILGIEAIIISIISMLSDPVFSSPANVEAAKQYKENYEVYKKKVKRLALKSME